MNQIIIFIICLLTSFILPTVLGVSYKAYEEEWYKKLKRPRVIWGLYAIFANVEYFRLNRAFWDSEKGKK